MEKEKRKPIKQNENDISKRKWYSLIGFLISIVLLTIAIFMSINQERNRQVAQLTYDNAIEVSSTDLNKSVSQTNRKLAINNNDNENNTINENSNQGQNTTNAEFQSNNNIENNQQSEENSGDENGNKLEENANNQNNEQLEENTSNNTNIEEAESKKTNPNQFIKPVEGEEISNFSMSSLIYSNTLQEWITHRGIDIKSEKGTEVKASKAGKVKLINNDPRYGVTIKIEHNEGFETIYSCMLDTANLKEEDNVEQGQIIGHVGNSGVFEVSDGMHLHFEMMKDGDYVNPDIYVK